MEATKTFVENPSGKLAVTVHAHAACGKKRPHLENYRRLVPQTELFMTVRILLLNWCD